MTRSNQYKEELRVERFDRINSLARFGAVCLSLCASGLGIWMLWAGTHEIQRVAVVVGMTILGLLIVVLGKNGIAHFNGDNAAEKPNWTMGIICLVGGACMLTVTYPSTQTGVETALATTQQVLTTQTRVDNSVGDQIETARAEIQTATATVESRRQSLASSQATVAQLQQNVGNERARGGCGPICTRLTEELRAAEADAERIRQDVTAAEAEIAAAQTRLRELQASQGEAGPPSEAAIVASTLDEWTLTAFKYVLPGIIEVLALFAYWLFPERYRARILLPEPAVAFAQVQEAAPPQPIVAKPPDFATEERRVSHAPAVKPAFRKSAIDRPSDAQRRATLVKQGLARLNGPKATPPLATDGGESNETQQKDAT